MTSIRLTPLNTPIQKIASSRPGAWLFSRILPSFDRLFFRLSSRRVTLTSLVTGLPVVILTCTGAKSGLTRTLPLLYFNDPQEPEAIAIIASNWGQSHYPAWYFNLKANPHAVCSVRGRSREYIAHEASGEEYERVWRTALVIYPGYTAYRQRAGTRHIPIIVMSPK